MKKILVPTDFSYDAANAVRYAYFFCKENSCEFSLLNGFDYSVYDPNMPPEILADTINQSTINSEEGLDFQINKFVSEFPDFKKYAAGKISAEGNVITSIEKTAKEGIFDLIIMGTKGASGLEEVLIGSNAYDVLSKSEIPVLVVPEKAQYSGLKNIMYAIDLTCSEIPAIKQAEQIVDFKKSELTFLHLSGELEDDLTYDEKKYFEEIKEKLKDISCKFEFAKCVSIPECLEDMIHKTKADLLIVSKKKRDFLENLFHKSVSKKLACHTDIPLLALHK